VFTSREPSANVQRTELQKAFLSLNTTEAEEAPARRPDKAQRTLRVVFFLRSPPSTRLRQIRTESREREKSGEARTRENSRPHAVHDYLFRRWKKKQQKKKSGEKENYVFSTNTSERREGPRKIRRRRENVEADVGNWLGDGGRCERRAQLSGVSCLPPVRTNTNKATCQGS